MIKLDEYPKSKKKFLGYIKECLLIFQKGLLEKLEASKDEPVPVIDDKTVEMATINIMENNIRSLYNFFDKQGLYLLISLYDGWIYQVPKVPFKPEECLRSNKSYDNREEAELEGFKQCFKTMEESGN